MECSLCERSSADESLFEFHHFEPVASRRKSDDGIVVCHQCGDQLHLVFTNNELRHIGYSLEAIKRQEKIYKYIRWVRNKPLTTHFTAAAKKRK